MKCVLLTTDTMHHRFFAGKISGAAEVLILLEKKKINTTKLFFNYVQKRKTLNSVINNPYFPQYHPLFQKKLDKFENEKFGPTILKDISDCFLSNPYSDINDKKCIELVRSYEPDILISFGTGRIGKDLLNQNCLKINIHRGILPKYRGLDSDLWACYFNDFTNIGTTIHTLHPDFDTGEIICQQKIQIKTPLELHQIRYYTTLLAAQMVLSIIEKMKTLETIPLLPQDLSKGFYYSYIPPLKRMIAEKHFHRFLRGYMK